MDYGRLQRTGALLFSVTVVTYTFNRANDHTRYNRLEGPFSGLVRELSNTGQILELLVVTSLLLVLVGVVGAGVLDGSGSGGEPSDRFERDSER